jgi:hypothetical protein
MSSLELSFKKEGNEDRDAGDIFGELLQDPDDLNINNGEKETNRESDNPCDQHVSEGHMISVEEAASVKNHDSNAARHLAPHQKEDDPNTAQMSFLKEFEEYTDKENVPLKQSYHTNNKQSTKGMEVDGMDVGDTSSIKSSFMCCIIEQTN